MATKSLYRTAATKRLFAVSRFYSASKGPLGSSNNSNGTAADKETHFGFQTIKESLKASKGDSLSIGLPSSLLTLCSQFTMSSPPSPHPMIP